MVDFLIPGKLTLIAESLTPLLTRVMMLKDGVILDDYLKSNDFSYRRQCLTFEFRNTPYMKVLKNLKTPDI